MKNKTSKLLLLTICTISLLSTGCSIKNNQNTIENKVENLGNYVEKEQEVLSNMILNEEENKVLEEAIQENIENNVNSTQIKNSYFVSSPYSQKVIEVNVDNVIENYSTEGDYGSLWLAVQDENINKGLFYSFIEKDTDIKLIENISKSFSNTNIVEISTIKVEIPVDKQSITETYKIEMTDDLGVKFYGLAFVMDYIDNNRILCVEISAMPESPLNMEQDIAKYSKIEFK